MAKHQTCIPINLQRYILITPALSTKYRMYYVLNITPIKQNGLILIGYENSMNI